MANLLPTCQDGNLPDDVAKLRLAIRDAWNVPAKTKKAVMKAIDKILKDPNVSTDYKLKTIRLIADLSKLDVDLYKVLRDDKPTDDGTTLNVNVIID